MNEPIYDIPEILEKIPYIELVCEAIDLFIGINFEEDFDLAVILAFKILTEISKEKLTAIDILELIESQLPTQVEDYNNEKKIFVIPL